ncbi:MAG: HD domain-containing protein [Chitinispirillaceae bacterium]|nr:HD domain-containing protein [Chitinispirillaceae bacterium]
MMFFFLGYILVFYTFFQGTRHISMFFLGVIFFFGTIFVFLGILLHADMLTSLKVQHKEIAEANRQLLKTEGVTILALAYQAELRDLETGKHLERTAHYVQLIAEELARIPKYRTYLTQGYIADLVKSAPLHDIGKVAIPDSILKKPGKLTPEEFEIIKKHCEYGMKVLQMADEKLDFRSFLKIAIQIVSTHHEKWNGSGYPFGMKGESIPLSGRIMALADVYDALRSDRCYKKACSHEETCMIISHEKGEHFDPEIVDVFNGVEKKFREISCALAG